MEGELAGAIAVLGAGLGDQVLGQRGALAGCDHPADDITAEDVEDDVEVEVGPLGRTAQFGDVPAPDFIRASPAARARRSAGAAPDRAAL